MKQIANGWYVFVSARGKSWVWVASRASGSTLYEGTKATAVSEAAKRRDAILEHLRRSDAGAGEEVFRGLIAVGEGSKVRE